MNEWSEYQKGNDSKSKETKGLPKTGIPKGKEAHESAVRRDSLDIQGPGPIDEWARKAVNSVND